MKKIWRVLYSMQPDQWIIKNKDQKKQSAYECNFKHDGCIGGNILIVVAKTAKEAIAIVVKKERIPLKYIEKDFIEEIKSQIIYRYEQPTD